MIGPSESKILKKYSLIGNIVECETELEDPQDAPKTCNLAIARKREGLVRIGDGEMNFTIVLKLGMQMMRNTML